jgi:predicted permease
MQFFWSELRSAARSLARIPAISVAGVLCLSLGIGATTAVFSAVSAVLLRPLPFEAPEELVTVYRTTPHFSTGPFSAPNYTDLARETETLEELAAFSPSPVLLTVRGEGLQVDAYRVTGNLFQSLGVHARLGRLLTPADDTERASPVVVVAEELWRERFTASSAIIGDTLLLDGKAHEVVGVVPSGFRVPHGNQVCRAGLWVPMRFSTKELSWRSSNWLMTLGRLIPGVSAEAADSELHGLMDGLVQTYPELKGEQLRVLPMVPEAVRKVHSPLLLLVGAVALVLLIAASNVASLLLVRGLQRHREIAIRTALGGSRWAVVRPVLAESLLLTTVGGAVGVALAWLGVRAIRTLATAQVPQMAGFGLDLRVIGFALALVLLVAVLCAVLPAWHASRTEPQAVMRWGTGIGPGRNQQALLRSVVISEIALSTVLLLGAGLVIRGFIDLIEREPGFDTAQILTLEATVSAEHYQEEAGALQLFLAPTEEAISRLPGVEAVGAITLLPYENWGWNFNIRYEGQPPDDPTQKPLVERRVVSPGLFAATGQQLLAGRLLQPSDDGSESAPSVVVANLALVTRDFPGSSPHEVVGRRFYAGDRLSTIVGVVSNIRNAGPVAEPRPEVYWTYAQGFTDATSFPMMIRVNGEPERLVKLVTAAIRDIDPGAAVSRALPMDELRAQSVGRPRFFLVLLSFFSAAALVLAMAGLFGVMSYVVAQRTLELGIRTALGANARATMTHVLGGGSWLVVTGIAAGLGGGVLLTRFLRGMLYGISPIDPATYTLVIIAMMVMALAAMVIPALRATRIDPVVALRAE